VYPHAAKKRKVGSIGGHLRRARKGGGGNKEKAGPGQYLLRDSHFPTKFYFPKKIGSTSQPKRSLDLRWIQKGGDNRKSSAVGGVLFLSGGSFEKVLRNFYPKVRGRGIVPPKDKVRKGGENEHSRWGDPRIMSKTKPAGKKRKNLSIHEVVLGKGKDGRSGGRGVRLRMRSDQR